MDPVPAGSAEPTNPPRRLAALIAAAVIVVDAVTKAVAVRALDDRGVVDLLGGRFHLELYRNFGGPANLLRDQTVLVSVLSLACVVLLAVLAWRARTTAAAVGFGLFLGGGMGNLLDRLLRDPGPFRGGVVDWIKPTLSGGSLNVADLAINAAVIVLLLSLLLGWGTRETDPARRPDRASAL